MIFEQIRNGGCLSYVVILVYCQFGLISTPAAATLRTMGYAHVVALDGGMQAWTDAEYPVERRAAAG